MKKLILFVLIGLFFAGSLMGSNVKTNQIFRLDKTINSQSIRILSNKIEKAHKKLPIKRPIIIKLNSPGGSVLSSYKLMNKIRGMQMEGRKFVGIVEVYCYSACFHILQILDVRASYPYASLMHHLISGGYPQEREDMNKAMDRVIAKRIGIPMLLWRQVSRSNIYINPYDALEINVIDKIVVKVNKTPQYIKIHGEESTFVDLNTDISKNKTKRSKNDTRIK